MTPDVAAIAAGLTKAQRKVVLRGWGASRTVWAVRRHQPVLFAFASSHSGEGQLREPTALGLAVRAHLLQDTTHD